jgi:hypothetical protein
MAITKIQSESLNLADDFAFTGTITGAGESNAPAFQAYRSTGQSVTTGVSTKIAFDTKQFDTNNCYDNSTNYRFTPTVAGKYFVYASAFYFGNTDSDIKECTMYINKNGSNLAQGSASWGDWPNSNLTNASPHVFSVLDMNGTTDYVQIYGTIYTGTNNNGSIQANWAMFGGFLVTT